MNKLPAQKVDGLIDGMALLEELATHKEPVAGLELARKLGMSPVRVNRLLKTFAYLGYAYRTSSRKYAPGPALHVLAVESMASSGLLRNAYQYLESRSELVPTVALGDALRADRHLEDIPGLTPELAKQLLHTRRNGYALVRNSKHYTLAVTIGEPAYAALAVSGMKTLDEIPPLVSQLKEYVRLIAE